MAKTILVESSPRNATTGAVVGAYLAGGGRRAYRHRGRNDWLAGIVAEPRFTSKIEFDQNGFSGGARPQIAALEFMPSLSSTLLSLAALHWIGATIEVFSGDDEAAVVTWSTLIKGVVTGATIRNGTISFTLRDSSAELDDPLITTRFNGGGDIEGDTAVAERVKRRSFGRVFNVEARMLLSAYNIHEIGDPSRPLQSIDDVKDMGRSASSLGFVAWQGSIAATLTALKNATAPEGGGVVAPSIACVKWWTRPQGPLTVDFKGEIGAGYIETAASIAERIVQAGSTLSVANVAAMNAVRSDPAGIHIDSASETGAQALDRLLKGVSLLWQARADGVIEMSEIKLTSPVETVRITEASRERLFKPVRTRRLGYQRNHRLHSDGEISAIPEFTNWLQPSAPPWEETAPGQRWIDTDDGNREYQRTKGVLSIGGIVPTIGGNPIYIGWISVTDARVAESVAAAAAAQARADQANDSANAALLELADIASDNVMTPVEKPKVILDYRVLTDEQSGIDFQASSFGITTERTSYNSSISSLSAYLATLSTPTLWNNLTGNTTIVGETFRNTFAAAYAARQVLLNKIADIAKARADLGVANAATAQATANAAQTLANSAAADAADAQGRIQNIVSDSVLDKSEKPQTVLEYDRITAEQSGIDTQAAAYSITTERTAYNNAVSALTTYLTGLSPAYTNYSADTTIIRTTFIAKFQDVYSARQTLLNKIAEIAGTRATWLNVRNSDPNAPDDNADVTAASQVTATLAGDKTVVADYLGAVTSGALAALVWGPSVVRGGSSIKISNDVSYSISETYGGTFAVNNSNGSSEKGNVSISAITAATAGGNLTITVSGIVLPRLSFKVMKVLADPPPPASGTDSKTWNSTELIAINATTYNPISSVKTVALASGQSLYGSATLDYNVSGVGGVFRTLTAKWQYSAAGANSWNDFAAGVTGFQARAPYSGGPPDYEWNDAEPGTVTVNQSKSGLSAGNYDIRMVGQINATGRTVTPAGDPLIEAKT